MILNVIIIDNSRRIKSAGRKAIGVKSNCLHKKFYHFLNRLLNVRPLISIMIWNARFKVTLHKKYCLYELFLKSWTLENLKLTIRFLIFYFLFQFSALKIHTSQATKEELDAIGTFHLQLRGKIDMKVNIMENWPIFNSYIPTIFLGKRSHDDVLAPRRKVNQRRTQSCGSRSQRRTCDHSVWCPLEPLPPNTLASQTGLLSPMGSQCDQTDPIILMDLDKDPGAGVRQEGQKL